VAGLIKNCCKSENVEYFADGEKVFAVSSVKGVTVENVEIEMPMIQMYVVKNDKLISAQPFYFDTAKFNSPEQIQFPLDESSSNVYKIFG